VENYLISETVTSEFVDVQEVRRGWVVGSYRRRIRIGRQSLKDSSTRTMKRRARVKSAIKLMLEKQQGTS